MNPSYEDSDPSSVLHNSRSWDLNRCEGNSNALLPLSLIFQNSLMISQELSRFHKNLAFSFSLIEIRIHLMGIPIHVVRASLRESRFESIAWGFESTSPSRPFWPFLKFRIHFLRIQILVFRQTYWNWDSNPFHRDSNPFLHFNLSCFYLINAQTDLNPIVKDSDPNTKKCILSVRWWISLRYKNIILETLI